MAKQRRHTGRREKKERITVHPEARAFGMGDIFREREGNNEPYREYSPRSLREAAGMLMEAYPGHPGISRLAEDAGFRSYNRSPRDIDEVTRISMLHRAESLSEFEPLANRGLTIRTDLIVSEGFALEAEVVNAEGLSEETIRQYKDAMQAILDDHYELNDWHDRTFERTFDLGVTGEMARKIPKLILDTPDGGKFLPGRFRCGGIMPHYINYVAVDPWDAERLTRLTLAPQIFEHRDPRDLEFRIVSPEYYGPDAGRLTGDMLFLAVNRRIGQSRGLSDLLPAMDWIDQHDQALLSDVDRALEMQKYIWDITLKQASSETVKAYAKELKNTRIRPGTIRVHNDSETWQSVQPELAMDETGKLREDLFIYSWGALGLPRHWYSEAEDTNRATADNMVGPAFAWARSRRQKVTSYIRTEHMLALQVAHEHGRLKVPRRHLGCKVVSRDPNRDQWEPTANAFKLMGDALTVMVTSKFMTQQDAIRVIHTMAKPFGIELTELDQVVKQLEEEKAAEMEAENPLQQAMNEVSAELERKRPQLRAVPADPDAKAEEDRKNGNGKVQAKREAAYAS